MGYSYEETIRRAFKSIIDERGIDHLVHFTDLRNLESILEHGILTRKELESSDIVQALGNGDARFDGNKDATCCSVQYPNMPLYQAKQRRSEFEYAFLILSTDIIVDKDCAFYPGNASEGWLSRRPIKKLSTSWAFEDMFAEVVKGERDGLIENETTHESAEVHVFDSIEPDYIDQIVIDDESYRIEFTEKYTDFEFLNWPW